MPSPPGSARPLRNLFSHVLKRIFRSKTVIAPSPDDTRVTVEHGQHDLPPGQLNNNMSAPLSILATQSISQGDIVDPAGPEYLRTSPSRPVTFAQESSVIRETSISSATSTDAMPTGSSTTVGIPRPVTQERDQRQSSTNKEMAKHVWHGFKLVSKNLEKFLSSTPFQIPVSVLNVLIDTADAVINNRESLVNLLHSIGERLAIVTNNLPREHLDDINPSCERFSDVLKEAENEFQKMYNEGIFKRILNADEEPQEIVNIFRRLDEATKTFELDLALASIRMVKKIKENGEILRLSNLRPIKEVTFNEVVREPCTQGTRKEIIESIIAWSKDTSSGSSPVYWLSGMAGTGKSTIAYTICQQLFGKDDAARRLGASFFCSRRVEGGRARRNIIPTIAHDLAHSFPTYGRALLNARFDARLPLLEDHISSMLIGPWITSSSTDRKLPPLVVVIDALDELEKGEGSAFLEQLLNEFAHREGTLQGLKFFVTSRKDPRIEEVCASLDSRAICRLDDVRKTVVEDDISHYLGTKLPELDKTQVGQLAAQASGLFIYAATAVRFILPPSIAEKPSRRLQQKRLDILLTAWPTRSQCGIDGLLVDRLYEEILREWLFPKAADDQLTAISVLQTVICTEEPILISDISQFLEEPDLDLQDVRNAIISLHAVLYVSDDRVYFYHKSFIDFMFDHTRFEDGDWVGMACPTPQRQICLAVSCFRLMDSLRFNICDLPSSYLDDFEVQDLPTRVDKNIPSALRYACRHWAKHVSKTPDDVETRAKNMQIYRTWLEKRLLFWMEAMNLLRLMGECYYALVTARKTFEKCLKSEGITDLLAAENLATSFADNIIADSTPHLYISALSTSSPDSNLISLWHRRFPKRPTVLALFEAECPSPYHFQHDDYVHSVCFSPDGTRIVCGCGDMTINIWDTATGKRLQQLHGHSRDVTSVCFSPIGPYIASGSHDQTVRIWHAGTGKHIYQLNGHQGGVWSVCFSPDGARVASGSNDKTVRGWDVQSGNQLQRLDGHGDWVRSVCFSPGGEYIVTGSNDKTLRLWDVHTWKQLHQIVGHTEPVYSVCFSPDGIHIVSGSEDKTVRVWDVSTGRQLQQFNGHKGGVLAVSVSGDGALIASSSDDDTVHLWDALSGNQFQRLDGHSDWVRSVCFSPDGTHLVTGSYDRTARTWDICTGRQLVSLREYGSSAQPSSLSSSVSLVNSASAKRTVRIWDTSKMSANKDLYLTLSTGRMDVLPTYGPPMRHLTEASSINNNWWARRNGWIVSSHNRRYIWLPSPMHEVLQCPDRLIISSKGCVRIDLSTGTFGTEWACCYDPNVV